VTTSEPISTLASMARASEKRWVVLVRGINLGRNKRLAMADFRALLEALGTDVRTYLASGNALVTTSGAKVTAAGLEREIAARLKANLGLDVKVLVRSAEELATVVDQNPFPQEGVETKQLQAAFLAEKPPAVKTDSLDPEQFAPDRFEFGDRVIYLHMPNGFMGSNLPDWEKVLGVAATIRTWNVVTKLRELAS
jgi:uncharacterized protein (DUF1697 family)